MLLIALTSGYLHILEKQRKVHQKSTNIFWPVREADNRIASAISRMRKNDNEIIIVLI